MVKEGIFPTHNISEKRIEVDQTKIDVIAKFPPTISLEGVQIFMVHVRFYWRFTKYISKVAISLCELLEKESAF